MSAGPSTEADRHPAQPNIRGGANHSCTRGGRRTVRSVAVSTEKGRYRDALAVGEFRVIFGSYVVSMLGDVVAAVALTVLVYQQSGSSFLAALTFTLAVPAAPVRRRAAVGPRRRHAAAAAARDVRPDRGVPRRRDGHPRPADRCAPGAAVRDEPAVAGVRRRSRRPAARHRPGRTRSCPRGRCCGWWRRVRNWSATPPPARSCSCCRRGRCCCSTPRTFLCSAAVLRLGLRRAPGAGRRPHRRRWRATRCAARARRCGCRGCARCCCSAGWCPPSPSGPRRSAAPGVAAHGASPGAVGWWLMALPAGTLIGESRRALAPAAGLANTADATAGGGRRSCRCCCSRSSEPADRRSALMVLPGLGAAYILGADTLLLPRRPRTLRGRVFTISRPGLMTHAGHRLRRGRRGGGVRAGRSRDRVRRRWPG